MDHRLTPANSRVAHQSLAGQRAGVSFVTPTRHLVAVPVAPLLAEPRARAPRNRELAFGEQFDLLEIHRGWAFGAALRDGYVGYIAADQLADHFQPPTHRVIAPSYQNAEPKLKTQGAPVPLPIGALVSVRATRHDHCDWAEIDCPATTPDMGGTAFVPMPHLAPLTPPAPDPVTEAERYLATPYLWAGNSGFGIDCSGLVQAALLACGIPCPGDSDMQQTAFPTATGPYQRGDLLFWKGHVAMVTDADTMIHANAHRMAVAHENIVAAITRIAKQGGGPVTAHTRPGKAQP